MLKDSPIESMLQQFRVRYGERHPRSAEMHAAAKKVLPGGDTRSGTFFPPHPPYTERAGGTYLHDVDGHTYLDFVNNYSSLIHGHAHPAVMEAVSRQLSQGSIYGTPCESQFRLAMLLCERVPSFERVRFCNSGTEATLGAIRAARAFTGRDRILKMEGGYHGTHDWALVSAKPRFGAKPPRGFPSLADGKGVPRTVLRQVLVAPFNDEATTRRIIEGNAQSLAAIIVEPVLGSAGRVPARPEYLRSLRELADRYGIVLIFDEVVSLRLAPGGAQQMLGVRPDLTAVAKIIGGGFPVGAFGGRADIMELWAPDRGLLPHSGTYNGNPVTMVAGLKTMELLTEEAYFKLNALGELLRARARQTLQDGGIVGQVTGVGSLMQIHFTKRPVADYRTAEQADKQLGALLHLSMLERGVFTASSGLICLSTPMTEGAVETFIRALKVSLEEIRPAVEKGRPDLLNR